jgi:hypothetical protein
MRRARQRNTKDQIRDWLSENVGGYSGYTSRLRSLVYDAITVVGVTALTLFTGYLLSRAPSTNNLNSIEPNSSYSTLANPDSLETKASSYVPRQSITPSFFPMND